jgi:hypothetical protein
MSERASMINRTNKKGTLTILFSESKPDAVNKIVELQSTSC